MDYGVGKIFFLAAIIQLFVVFGDGVFRLAKFNRINKTDGRLHILVRMGFSLSMVICSGLIYLNMTNVLYHKYYLCIVIGMIFSFFGDMAMANVIRSKTPAITGMGFFALTHFSYIAAYINGFSNYPSPYKYYLPLIIGGLVLILILWLIINKTSTAPKLVKGCSLVYSIIIGFMALTALNLTLISKGAFIFTFIGALLFIISDSLIAIGEIGGKKINHVQFLIWFTYVPAQMLIVYNIFYLIRQF